MNTAPARAIKTPDSLECHPRITYQNASQAARDKAVMLRDVFQPDLDLAANDTRTWTEIQSSLVARHARVFGYAITGKTALDFYRQYLREDAGRGDFLNLNLYVPQNAARRHRPEKGANFNHDDLGTAIQNILTSRKDKNRPGILTKIQKQSVWVAMHAHLDVIAPPGSMHREAAKRSIRRYVMNVAPMMAASPVALKRNFDRKLAALESLGGKPSAIADRRELNSGWYRGPEISAEVTNAILAHSTFNRGSDLAPAWRDYLAGRIPGVTPDKELLSYYATNPISKSHVPHRIRELARYKLPALKILHHGTYQYEQTGYPDLSLDTILRERFKVIEGVRTITDLETRELTKLLWTLNARLASWKRRAVQKSKSAEMATAA